MTEHNISPAEAVATVSNGRAFLLDVRNPAEAQVHGIAKGATLIPLDDLAARARPTHPQFPRAMQNAQTIIVYCAAGIRAKAAANILNKMGYKDVRNLGSLENWKAAGGQVVSI